VVDRALLSIYLNDHLAGATVGRELARRIARAHRGHPDGPALEDLAREVDEDREALLSLMRTVDVSIDRVKVALGWTADKLGRLKLNGRLVSRSPLSHLVEIEALHLGVRGKWKLWEALKQVTDQEPRLDPAELNALSARAQSQFEQLDECHRRAAREAFG